MIPGRRPDRRDAARRPAGLRHAGLTRATRRDGAVGEEQQPAASGQTRQSIPPMLRDDRDHRPADDLDAGAGAFRDRFRLGPQPGRRPQSRRHALSLPRGDDVGHHRPQPIPQLPRRRTRKRCRHREGDGRPRVGTLGNDGGLVHKKPRGERCWLPKNRRGNPQRKPAAGAIFNPGKPRDDERPAKA